MQTTDAVLDGPAVGAPSATVAASRAAASRASVWLFASAIFLSAFLLFLVQPMIARMVLPVLGGAASVWNACVVFFQIVLLAGYGYAHGLSRESSTRRQVAVHLTLLALPLAILPFTIDRSSLVPPAGNPVLWLLLLLTMTIGLPFFALSTTASVLQHWFSRSGHPRAKDPYFLYAASNLGSLLALAAYPIAVEPVFTLGQQGRLWSGGYAAFVALAGACGLSAWARSGRPGEREPQVDTTPAMASPVTLGRRGWWVLLAFVPSSLMLAVTTYASTDIAAVPLFWIVPLAVYLLTFIVAFSARGSAFLAIAARAVPLLIVPLIMFMSTTASAPATVMFGVHLAVFASIALLCHARLAHDRPPAGALTEFYFWMSFGGMLGGVFNALLAPLLFTGIVEYRLVLIVACLCLPAAAVPPGTRPPDQRRAALLMAMPLLVGALAAGVLVWARSSSPAAALLMAMIGIPATVAFAQRRHPVRFALCLASMFAAGWVVGSPGRVLHAERTFFGVYRVGVDDENRYHALVNGTTLHGVQALREQPHEPLSYYHRTGPVGQMLAGVPGAAGQQVAVIGLGVGSVAEYARPGQRWTFYEIDPAVERIARTPAFFTHLEACGNRCQVVIGDARLSIGAADASSYNFIVLDAFSSDAIPVHLLTREAVGVYLSKLAPGGAVAFHVSNTHLTLEPVVAAVVASHGLTGVVQFDANPEKIERKSASHWVVAARSPEHLGALAADPRWRPLEAPAGTPVWTDDFSNILSVLKRRR